MFEKIMVPTDGSEYAARAEDIAIELAGRLGAVVVAVHVIDEKLIYPFEVLEEEGKEILGAVQRKGREAGVRVDEVLVFGSPAHDMKKIADKTGADLVVIASHGRSGLEKILMGSVAETTLKTVTVPVLLVK
ncbi:universal stress protein [Methanothermobacter wolfeii]|uniref:Universal stress protein n=1 Tax=Methanothermobacter wolfeii TaxID=145261 RepID=A0A9E7RU47_METWO|nr:MULTISPECIES: universal stress protein [Methanothermobacter]MDI6702472.1 universal stress protein [Methanothermobacter wolfeii]MDI6841893.1 universal stress protein [Methanothermobacter wolfeii]NLM02992.1 universal stress protein [Methanothermobacter wolfeii]QHN06077.1 universal stress protein [Methanothermobacter sp. THM-1]UXH32276.1 universal stress protein [Methanothermobacter wolfeii]